MKDENPIAKFKELLTRFVAKKLLTHAIVEMAYNHLFQKGSMPFFTVTELHETMIYLKDVMETNGLRTLEELLDYYVRKKQTIRAYIDSIVLETPKGPEYIPETLPGSWTKPADGEESSPALPTDEADGLSCRAHPGMCLLLAPADQPCIDLPPLVQRKTGKSKRKPGDN